MYCPPAYRMADTAQVHALLRSQPLCWIVRTPTGGPETVAGLSLAADPIPLMLDAGAGPQGHDLLWGHAAKANPLSTLPEEGQGALLICQGPSAFVSAQDFASKADDPMTVPTYDYVVVQADVWVRPVRDALAMRQLMSRLSACMEARTGSAWRMEDMTPEALAHMMGHIVGLQVEVLAWQGKAKLGQRDDARDRASVAQALRRRAGSPAETAIASMIPQG